MDTPAPPPSPRHQALARKIKRDLGKGHAVADRLFDELLSHAAYDRSIIHWTPVAVAQAAVRFLQPTSLTRVLDVGSGCGKFCLVAALSAPGHYTGIELRPGLVAEARQLKGLFELGQDCEFRQGDATEHDWSSYNAIYLFNPFYEGILPAGELRPRYIDNQIDLSPARFRQYLEAIHNKLQECQRGTKVVTYHGFGAEPPASYRLQQSLTVGTGELLLWVKQG